MKLKQIYKWALAIVVLASFGQNVFSQSYSAGVNVDSPNPNAVLHLVSPNNNQGVLIPSLGTNQRTAMSSELDLEDNGMLVYDGDEEIFYYWMNSSWIAILISETDPTVPDAIKDGIDWSELSGIPADILDGDDTGSTSLVGFTSDDLVEGTTNLYLTPAEVALIASALQTETDPTVPEAIKDGIDWSELSGIPADIADGDDGGGITDLTTFSSDDLAEGTTNLYVTPAERTLIGTAVQTEVDGIWTGDRAILGSVGTINDGGNLIDWTQLKNVPADFSDGVDDGGGITDLTTFSSDDLAEGTTNLYVTPAERTLIGTAVQTEVDGVWTGDRAILGSVGTINDGGNLIDWTQLKNVPADFSDGVDDGGGITDLTTFSSDDLTEGATNLYLTTAERTLIGTAVQTEVDGVWTGDRATLGSAGTINDGGNLIDWTQLKNVPADFSDGVDESGIADLTTFDSDDLTEGATNLYLTPAERTLIGTAVQTEVDGVWTGDRATLGSAGTINDGGNLIDWTQLKNVPADFSDGVDESGIADLTTFNSDDLTEGTTNLYVTPAERTLIGTAVQTEVDGVWTGDRAILGSVGTINDGGNLIDWTQLKNVPADFSDGVDESGIADLTTFDSDDLTEGATNLYLTPAERTLIGTAVQTEVDGVWTGDRAILGSAGTINDGGNLIDWTQLKNVPADFSDGVDESGIADLTTFDSDDLTEGATNLYLTTAERTLIGTAVQTEVDGVWTGDRAILGSAGTINDGGNLIDWTQLKNVPLGFSDGTDESGIADLTTFDSDDLTEGATNLYLTPAERTLIGTAVQTEVDGVWTGDRATLGSAGTINDGGNLIDWTQLKNVPLGFSDGTDESGIADLTTFDSDDLAEGATNLYLTPAERTLIGTAVQTEVDGVWTGDRAILGSAGTINDGGNLIDWTQLKNVPIDFSDGVDDSGIADLTTFNSDDLLEGTTNLYYTDTRVNSLLSLTSATSLNDITNVGSGAIITTAERADIAGLGTAASLDVGTGPGEIVTFGVGGDLLLGTSNVTANSFSGDGAGLTDVSVSNITGLGTAASLDVGTGPGEIVTFGVGGDLLLGTSNVTASSFSGDGAGLTDISAGNITGLGTAASFDVGTGISQVVQLDAAANLDLTGADITADTFTGDGSALTDISAGNITGLGTASSFDVGTGIGQVVQLDAAANLDLTGADITADTFTGDGSALTDISAGNITGLGTAASFDVGTGIGQVVQLDAAANLDLTGADITADSFIGDGSLLTNLPDTPVLTNVNGTITGDGLLGTELGVNVGTGAGQILQFATANILPALNGSALTDVAAGASLDDVFNLTDDVTGNKAFFELANLTATHTYNLPDGGGTIALESDLGSLSAPLQVENTIGIFHFENTTNGITGDFVGSNLYVDKTNVTDNDILRANTDVGSFIFFDNGTISFLNATAGAADSPLDLMNDATSVLTLNPSGTSEFDGFLGVGIDPLYSLDIEGTDAIRLPRGNDAERPGIPVNGLLRYNNEFGFEGFEGYSQGAWIKLGGSTVTGLTSDITFEEGTDRAISVNNAIVGAGSSLTVNAASGDSGSDGGNLTLGAGSGFDIGGDIFIRAGDANNGSGDAGSIVLTTGSATGNPANDGIVDILSSSALKIPIGLDTERPLLPAAGMMRYSIESGAEGFEGYNGTTWEHLGGGSDFFIDGNGNTLTSISDAPTISTGADNTLFGFGSGDALTTGSENIFLGPNVGANASDGSSNVFIGSNIAPLLFTGGEDNILIGTGVGDAIVSGANNNILIGTGAGLNVDGLDNVVIGTNANAATTVGSAVAIGTGASVGGTNGVAIGFGSSASGLEGLALGRSASADGDNSVAIGANTDATVDNTIILGDGTPIYNVGINNVNPTTALDVIGTTTTDDLNVNANASINGDATLYGNLISIPSAPIAGTITVTSRIIPVNADVVDIVPGVEGQEVILIATNTLNVTNGGGVILNFLTDFSMNPNDTIHLVFYNGAWLEVSRSSNN